MIVVVVESSKVMVTVEIVIAMREVDNDNGSNGDGGSRR